MRNPLKRKSLLFNDSSLDVVGFPAAPLALLDGIATGQFTQAQLLSGRYLTPLGMYLSHPAVSATINLLARGLADCPIDLWSQVSGDVVRAGVRNPVTAVLANPDPSQPTAEWTTALVIDLLCHGEFMHLIVDDKYLIRLDPLQVTVQGQGANITGYTVGGKSYPVADVLHGLLFNPLDAKRGLSPLWPLRSLITEDLLSLTWRANLWRGPGAWLERPMDAPILDKKGAGNVSEAFKAHGPGDVPVVDEGMKLHAREMLNTSGLVASQQFVQAQVAATLGVQPSAVGASDRNLDAAQRGLHSEGLQPLASIIESAVNTQLIPRLMPNALPGQYAVRYDFSEKMAGTASDRAKRYALELGGAAYKCPNDVRAEEGLPPIEGGDVLPVKVAAPAGGAS